MGVPEPCSVHGGGVLPAALVAPEGDDAADLYWRGAVMSPVASGVAIDLRGAAWLVESSALWRGHPGGVHAKVRRCNITGKLHPRTAAVTAYGITFTEGAPVAVLGVLAVTGSSESGGQIATQAELTPVGPWVGHEGDLVVLGGRRWEQVGDPVDRSATGGSSGVPVVRLRRVRDGAARDQ